MAAAGEAAAVVAPPDCAIPVVVAANKDELAAAGISGEALKSPFHVVVPDEVTAIATLIPILRVSSSR